MPPSHVLVPLDGSPLATEALAHALETFECPITVLNVVTPLDWGTIEGPLLDMDEDRLREAETRVEDLVEETRAEKGGRTVEIVIETGEPAETILAYAESHDVDHIVIGSHSEGGGELRRRLLGTVSTAVIGDSDVPVTVIK